MKKSLHAAAFAVCAAIPLAASAFSAEDHLAWLKTNQSAKPQFVDGDTITYEKAELIKPFVPAEYQDIMIFRAWR